MNELTERLSYRLSIRQSNRNHSKEPELVEEPETQNESQTINSSSLPHKRKPSQKGFGDANQPGNDKTKSKIQKPNKTSEVDRNNVRRQIATLKTVSHSKLIYQLRTPGLVRPDLYYLSPLFYAYVRSVECTGGKPLEKDNKFLEHFSQNVLAFHQTSSLHPNTNRKKSVQPPDKMMKKSNPKTPGFAMGTNGGKDLEKITVMFDLDETLIHCPEKVKETACKPNITMEELVSLNIKIRPHVVKCLQKLKGSFTLGLFTSAHKDYADRMVSLFDPGNTLFDFRYYGDSCIDLGGGILIKDLKILNKPKLDRHLIVDNNMYCYGRNLQNGIAILPFTGDDSDEELLGLVQYLSFLSSFSNPVDINSFYFGLDLIQQYTGNNSLLPQLILDRIVEVSSKIKFPQEPSPQKP